MNYEIHLSVIPNLIGNPAMSDKFWIPAPRFHEDKFCGNDNHGYLVIQSKLAY